MGQRLPSVPLFLPTIQSFEATASATTVRTAPHAEWRNRVMIFGTGNVQRDLSLECSGGARITATTANSVEVSGIAPASGRQQITVTATRKSDGRKAAAAFEVNAAPLDAPRLPSTLYAGQTAELNFGSSDVPAGQISVEIVENDKIVNNRDNGGSVFQYAPQSLSGTVRFQRYIAGQLVDKYSIPIRSLPFPHVDQPRQNDDEAIVQTTSYGAMAGVPNKVVLKVVQGNADDPEELTDRYRFDPVTQTHQQFWRVRRRGEGGVFTFSAYALDMRGSMFKSNTVKFYGK